MKTEQNQEKQNFVVSLNSPVTGKEYSEAWKLLTPQEKEYAYHLSRAAFVGSFISSHQSSYEAPVLLSMAIFYFKGRDFQELAKAVPENCQALWDRFLAYWAALVSNKANYFYYGGKKFVPDMEAQQFLEIYKSAPHFNQFEDMFGESFETMWSKVDKEVFEYGEPYAMRNLPEKGGITSYYSRNITSADIQIAQRFCESKQISLLNTRLFKKTNPQNEEYLEVTIASVEAKTETHEFEGKQIVIKHGEFSKYLELANGHLCRAMKVARDENQKNMIANLVSHFQTGEMETHKQSTREWLKDCNPPVETFTGFIETYVDPVNVRAEFESIVALVNRNRSKKYQKLVETSGKILESMPWDKEYHLEEFKTPEFSSIDIVVSGCGWCSLGVNLPNYDRIRDQHGFKNMYMSNNLRNYFINSDRFVPKEDLPRIEKVATRCQELNVALHELIGHGSGKLFMEKENGSLNFDPATTPNMLNPNDKVTWYKHNETWNTKFGQVSTSFEECRADVSALYLGYLPEAYTLFDISSEEINDVMWYMSVNYFRKAIFGMKVFEPKNQKWGQAHTQGNYVIFNYIFTNQDQTNKIVDIVLNEGETDFTLIVDEPRLHSEGRRLAGELLRALQQYRSTADSEGGTAFYNKYSEVNAFMLKLRAIVLGVECPVKLDLYFDIEREGEEQWKINKYPENFQGILQSLTTNWKLTAKDLIQLVIKEWKVNASIIRV